MLFWASEKSRGQQQNPVAYAGLGMLNPAQYKNLQAIPAFYRIFSQMKAG